MPSTEDPDSEARVCGACWLCEGGVRAPGMLDVQVEAHAPAGGSRRGWTGGPGANQDSRLACHGLTRNRVTIFFFPFPFSLLIFDFCYWLPSYIYTGSYSSGLECRRDR